MSEKKVYWLSHKLYGLHDPGPWHPETPRRFYTLEEMVSQGVKEVEIERLAPRPANENEILWVHKKNYIDFVLETDGQESAFDPDTHTSKDSVQAALMAAGGAIELVRAVMDTDIKSGFGNLRPPGHHAEANRAMGFCIFNNVAIAAHYAVEERGLKRVAIIDPDGHHGNGTQHAFYEDPRVFYMSLHRFPFYPGTGRLEEVGRGNGEGYTLNFPFGGGATDNDYLTAFDDVIIPALRAFKPELVLVSAGYDAHERDPLVGMHVTTECFGAMMGKLKKLAEETAQGRIVALLEGGYDLRALSESVTETLRAFAGVEYKKEAGKPSSAGEETIKRSYEVAEHYWEI